MLHSAFSNRCGPAATWATWAWSLSFVLFLPLAFGGVPHFSHLGWLVGLGLWQRSRAVSWRVFLAWPALPARSSSHLTGGLVTTGGCLMFLQAALAPSLLWAAGEECLPGAPTLGLAV